MACIDFDVDDHLHEATTEALLAALLSRRDENIISSLADAIEAGDIEDARQLLVGWIGGIRPDRDEQFAAVRKGKHPFLRLKGGARG